MVLRVERLLLTLLRLLSLLMTLLRLQSHDVFRRRLVVLDLADGVGEGAVYWAWTASVGELTELGLLERCLFSVWVDISVDVCDTHCDFWLVGERMCVVLWDMSFLLC